MKGDTRRQRQPRTKSGRKTSLGDKLAAAAKSEIMKGDKLGRQAGSGSQERNQVMKEDKLGETRRQRQSKAKSCEIMKRDKFGDKLTAETKSEIMQGDKLGRQGGGGSQEQNQEERLAWETS